MNKCFIGLLQVSLTAYISFIRIFSLLQLADIGLLQLVVISYMLLKGLDLRSSCIRSERTTINATSAHLTEDCFYLGKDIQ